MGMGNPPPPPSICLLKHLLAQFHIRTGSEQGMLQFTRGLCPEDKENTSNVGVFEYELCSVVALIDAPS